MERFDWYKASFPGVDADEFLGEWMDQFPLSSFTPAKGQHGYTHGGVIRIGDFDAARLLFGGNNDAPMNVAASGMQTQRFVDFARATFPDHSVTRLDPCIDFESPGAWTYLLDAVVDTKHHHKVKSREMGDWLDGGLKGRTIYLGAPSSDVQFRLYEKGKQLGEGYSPDWVRAELQWRPKKLAKLSCASIMPETCWGASRWSQDLRQRFGMAGVEKVEKEGWQRTPLEARVSALVKQYGRTLMELQELLGSPEQVGSHLFEKMVQRQSPLKADGRSKP